MVVDDVYMHTAGLCGIRETRSSVGEIRLKLGGVVVPRTVLETLVVVMRYRNSGVFTTDVAWDGVIVSVVAFRGCISRSVVSRVISESAVMGLKSDIIRNALSIGVMDIRCCISRCDVVTIVIGSGIVVYRRNVRKITIGGNVTPFLSSWWGWGVGCGLMEDRVDICGGGIVWENGMYCSGDGRARDSGAVGGDGR